MTTNIWLLLMAIAVLITGFATHSITKTYAQVVLTNALNKQDAANQKQCDADKALTSTTEESYAQNLSALNARVAGLVQSHKTCVKIAASPARQPDGSTGADPNGSEATVDPVRLYGLAGECEKYRLQLIGLQGFDKQIWKDNGQ